MDRNRWRRGGERGSVLLASLMILLMLTLLGLAAVQTTTLEERMAGNSSEQSRAFEAAEAALRDAEAEIDAGTRFASKYTGSALDPDSLRRTVGSVGFSAACYDGNPLHTGLCYPGPSASTKTGYLAGTDATKYTSYGAVTGAANLAPGILAAQPRYLIDFTCEAVPGSSNCQFSYRITAMGFGPRMSSRSVLEAIYRTD